MRPGSPRQLSLLIAILCAVAIGAAVPAMAGARITNPPGATEGDQYFEEVPNGKGSGSPNGGGGSGAGAAAGGVAADQSLRALGEDGQAAADLAEANTPPAGAKATEKPASEPASSPTEGEGGMGVLFPLLIAGTAVVAIAYGLRRRLYPA